MWDSMLTTTFTSKLAGSRFFFPLGNLLLYKPQPWQWSITQCDPNPSYFPNWGASGEKSSATVPDVLYLGSVEPLIRFELVYLK